ncbi:hypothetical protein BC936DRAFT_144556 [Jimgerdemannia flammicorona]|uniref:FAD-binding domain-containing protein n=1 Tax=Jimgerdemannia flammicorona TaxID=994334 RepID=A0A433DC79_9FUNG|nr:hypothetical protein BC936DRAFT_144556 [Jimgerdemannia flammicorona]
MYTLNVSKLWCLNQQYLTSSLLISDKLDKHVERSGACHLLPRTMEIIAKHLPDVADEIEQIAFRVPESVTYSEGKKIGWASYSYQTCRYQDACCLPSKRAVELILEKKLQSLGITIERSTTVTDFEVEDVDGPDRNLAHPIMARLQKLSGSSTTETVVGARYMIAADGPKSFCRRKLGIAFEGPDEVLQMADLGLVAKTNHPDLNNVCIPFNSVSQLHQKRK